MLKWVAVDEKIWKKELAGIQEGAEASESIFGREMCREGILVRNAADGVLWKGQFVAKEGVVITMDAGLYEVAVRYGMPVIWYWCENDVPEGARYLVQGMDGVDACYVRMVYCRNYGMPLTIAMGKDWVLREFTAQDKEAVCQCITAYPDVCLVDGISVRDEWTDAVSSYVDNMYGFYGYGMWLVQEKKSHTVMGWFGLENISSDDVARDSTLHKILESSFCLQAGYLLLPQYHHCGYGREVLRAVIDYGYKQAGAQCIVALIHRENIASQKLALAMGMEYIEDTCYCGIYLMVYIRCNNC